MYILIWRSVLSIFAFNRKQKGINQQACRMSFFISAAHVNAAANNVATQWPLCSRFWSTNNWINGSVWCVPPVINNQAMAWCWKMITGNESNVSALRNTSTRIGELYTRTSTPEIPAIAVCVCNRTDNVADHNLSTFVYDAGFNLMLVRAPVRNPNILHCKSFWISCSVGECQQTLHALWATYARTRMKIMNKFRMDFGWNLAIHSENFHDFHRKAIHHFH